MVSLELPYLSMDIREHLDRRGKSPFGDWYRKLDNQAAARIAVAIERIQQGSSSDARSVGDGVAEYRINWGPGYRIYFAFDGTKLIILLGGGTKHRQQNDIDKAKNCWKDYKTRRKQEAGLCR